MGRLSLILSFSFSVTAEHRSETQASVLNRQKVEHGVRVGFQGKTRQETRPSRLVATSNGAKSVVQRHW